MAKKISVKVPATKEQIKEMIRLRGDKSRGHNSQGQPLPYSKLGGYLIENFGEQISDAIRKDQDNG
jgi:hypothetical protein